MTYPELLDAVKLLPRGEKVHLMESLKDEIGELTREEVLLAKYFPPGAVFELREPIFAPEAAAILLSMLEAEKQKT